MPNFKTRFSGALKWLANNRSFLCFVLVPVAVLALYYALIATDRFVSESKLIVKKTDDTSTGSSAISSILGSSSGKEDALYLKEYIQSYDMLVYLDKKVGLRKAYEDKNADYFSRLKSIFYNVTREDFLDYYRKHVDVNYDDTSNVLTIRVDTFKTEFSRQVNQLILQQCEQFINDISHKIADEQMRFVENELVRVKERMEQAKVTMAEFQNKYNVLDPAAQAAAASSMVASMEQTLASQEADLANLKTFLQAGSYQIATLKNKIGALRKQIEKEKKAIAGAGDDHMNKIALQFINLKADMDYVVDVYKADLAALEKIRVDASRKLKNVVIIASPTLQEEAEYPRKAYNLATVLIVLLGVYGIIRMIVATIKEHKE